MEYTKEELQTLLQVLQNTPTQNLQVASVLIQLAQKTAKMIEKINKTSAKEGEDHKVVSQVTEKLASE